jgi:small-conductance mechanosensitive channel
MWARFRDQTVRNFSSFKDYASEKMHWILLSGLFLVTSTLLLRTVRKRLADDLKNQRSVVGANQVLDRPFTSSLLFVAFLNSILHPNAPHAWYNAVLLVGLIALVRLLPGFVPSKLVSFSFILLGLRALELVNSQIPEGTSLGRLLTVSIILISLVSLNRFMSRIKAIEEVSRGWSNFLRVAAWLGILILVLALLAGISSNLALAALLASGTVRTAFLALSFWAAFSIFRGILFLSLRSEIALKSRLIQMNRDLVFRKILQIVGALTLISLVIAVPYAFSVLDPVSSTVIESLTTPLNLRALSFSPADLLAFIFLAWLSFQVSRLVCFVLDEDFLPRLTLPRGVPAAISHLTHYAILLLGFLIALTAAGFDVGRLTILASAFGVGIGFGLQNVVNNFVSGLILLFERPVHVGDKIQLSQDVIGEVTRIGIRASVVKSVDGADILVPNGNLISNELTNWTLSDRKRRITIPVGVAYGTKPRKVVEMLKELAAAHPEVLSDPAPVVFFMGFGESSLDFSVRVWVGQFEKSFQVRSDLALAINDAFEEQGIEIPFPQRDLHLRSVPGELKLEDATRQQQEVK